MEPEDNKSDWGDNCELASNNYLQCDVQAVSMDISLITRVVHVNICLNGKMNKHKHEEEENSEDLKFRSRPVTAGGLQNGIRFFTTAMSALDRIEGLMSEIEQTKALVHQMMGEFSSAGGRMRISPEGQTKKVRSEKKELKDKDVSAASRSFYLIFFGARAVSIARPCLRLRIATSLQS